MRMIFLTSYVLPPDTKAYFTVPGLIASTKSKTAWLVEMAGSLNELMLLDFFAFFNCKTNVKVKLL